MIKIRVHSDDYKIVKGKKEYRGELTTNAGTSEIRVPEENIKKSPKDFQVM